MKDLSSEFVAKVECGYIIWSLVVFYKGRKLVGVIKVSNSR